MTRRRMGRLAALAWVGLAVACTSGTDSSGGPAGNTELNLNIVNPGGTSGELGFSIDRVDYRITCAGNPGAPIPDADTSGTAYAYDDSVDISGAFEVIDTRVPPVWQAVMDLPPGDCTITLSVYEDDEIVCVGSQTLAILEDGTTKYDIVLVCSLSVDLPDGMADVDGTFEFITGNICPKLYILNAVPTVIGFLPKTTEVQYRAKDPDNTCGNNCDPQTCDFSNPPVCSPYPSNINDPACNPAAGGDPNSVDCQAGVYAGLVCTISAWPASTPGVPGGTFTSPLDGVTPVGPVLPVNLNLASGVPGVILPGLGGPAGTNAANSPAYPPLPNVNGSLPPLVYECPASSVGQVLMNLDCSDGDAECDQNKQIVVQCPGIDYFCPPNFCDASSECLTDGTCDAQCDPACDPALAFYDATECCSAPNPGDSCGVDECSWCVGQDVNQPDGTPCTVGGNSCLGGVCVECAVDADCASTPAPVVPGTCQLPNTCVANSCVAGGAAPDGTVCINGNCDGTGAALCACQFISIPPPQQSVILGMGCQNNVTADVSILPFQLDVDPSPIIAGAITPVVIGGVAEFAEFFLDAAQGAVPGGVTAADLITVAADVTIRTGGTLPTTTLAEPFIPKTCLIGGAACLAINDAPSVPGSRPNSDCVPVGTFNPCQAIVVLPTSADCTPGGTCDLIGKGPGTSQCDTNGFCVTGGLPLPLVPVATSFTAAASGNVTFGFNDTTTGALPLNVDGTYNLPGSVFTDPPTPNEIKVNASGLSVALRCTMAVDSGGPDGVGVPDQSSPTPAANLNTFNIQIPGPGGGGCP